MTDDRSAPDIETDIHPDSPVDQVRRLARDVRALAFAELDYAKARLSYSGRIVRNAGLWALFAILCLTGSLIALILGLLLIIASYTGPLIATAIVVLTFLIAAAVAALRARSVARHLRLDVADD